MKKIIFSVIIILVIAGAGFACWYYFAQSEAGSNGETAYVTSVGTLTGVNKGMQNRFSGVVEAQEIWNADVMQDRTVKELLVEEGQQVEVGTALFTYDVESLQTDLSQADLDLERIDTSISNLTEQIAQLEKEKTKAAQGDKFNYTAQIQTAEMEIKQAEYERKSKEADIKRINQSIENSTVYCQLAGVIKSINTNGAINSSTGQTEPYISVLASGDLQIKGSVNEQNLSEIIVGIPVLVYSRVDDTVWTGVINKLDTENPNSGNSNGYSSSGETSTTFPFYITLDSAIDLKMGQHVYIEMNLGQEEKKEGLWLSEYYLVMEEDAAYVWAQDSNEKLEKRKITLGAYDEALGEYEIVGGLTIEDKIAMPADYLEEGMNTEVGEIGGNSNINAGEVNQDEINLDEMDLEGQVIDEGDVQVLPEEGEAIDRTVMEPQEQDQVVTEEAQ